MPKADEEKAIRAIQAQYHVTRKRAEAIYYGHLQNEKKHRQVAHLERRSAAFAKRSLVAKKTKK